MKTLNDLTPMQLRRAADIKDQIDSLKTELDSIFNPMPLIKGPVDLGKLIRNGRRRMSAVARAKISAAAKLRCAKARKAGRNSL